MATQSTGRALSSLYNLFEQDGLNTIPSNAYTDSLFLNLLYSSYISDNILPVILFEYECN